MFRKFDSAGIPAYRRDIDIAIVEGFFSGVIAPAGRKIKRYLGDMRNAGDARGHRSSGMENKNLAPLSSGEIMKGRSTSGISATVVVLLLAGCHPAGAQSISSVIAAGSKKLFVCESGAGALRSDDGGVHWKPVNANVWDSTYASLLSSDSAGNLILATGYANVYSSTNEGEAWVLTTSGLPANAGAYCLGQNASGQAFFGNNIGLYRQAIPGGGWTKVSDGLLYDPAVLSLTMTDSGKLFASSSAVGPGGVVQVSYRSPDGGDTWARIDSGRVFYAMTHAGEDTLFAGGYLTGIQRSTNGGISWSSLGSTDTWIRAFSADGRYVYCGSNTGRGVHRMLRSLAISGVSLYAGTTSGLFLSTDDGLTWVDVAITTSVADQPGTRPVDFTVEQNYPNPFNPSTIIRYDVPRAGHLEIDVYDLLGRNVGTMFRGIAAAGRHETNIDGAGLPGGVYFCRMVYEHAVRTVRMALIK
jgi:hypothetical protein